MATVFGKKQLKTKRARLAIAKRTLVSAEPKVATDVNEVIFLQSKSSQEVKRSRFSNSEALRLLNRIL